MRLENSSEPPKTFPVVYKSRGLLGPPWKVPRTSQGISGGLKLQQVNLSILHASRRIAEHFQRSEAW